MPTFVSARYVTNEMPPPAPQLLICAVADDDTIWWLDDNCTQGDWLRYIEQGGTIDPPLQTKPT